MPTPPTATLAQGSWSPGSSPGQDQGGSPDQTPEPRGPLTRLGDSASHAGVVHCKPRPSGTPGWAAATLGWAGEERGLWEQKPAPPQMSPTKERLTDHGTVPEGLSQPMSWHQRSPPLPVTLGPVLFLHSVCPPTPSPVLGWRHSWSPQFPCPTCLRHPVPQLLSQ